MARRRNPSSPNRAHLFTSNGDRSAQSWKSRPVVALAATTTVGYGVLFYAYGVLLVPMEADLHWSRSFLTGAFSGALLVSALLTVAVGRWLDRHAPRPLFMGGALAAVVLVGAWAMARGKVMFALVWLLLGGCQAVLFYEPAFTVLTKWYRGLERHRAVTAVTLLAGLASTIFGPLTAALERAFGWRTAVLVLAGLLGAVTIPCFAMGLGPPAASAALDDVAAAGSSRHSAPRDVIASGQFWLLTAAYLLNAVTTFAIAVHIVPYLRAHGLSGTTAASALGAIGLVQVLGRSTFTRLSARRAAIEVGTWALAAKALGIAFLLVVPGWTGIGLFIAIYGSANGIGTLTRAMTVAELYGAEHYGTISSIIAAVSAVGGALAPFGAAAAIDRVGRDTPVFAALAALCLAAAIINRGVATSHGPPAVAIGVDELEADPAP